MGKLRGFLERKPSLPGVWAGMGQLQQAQGHLALRCHLAGLSPVAILVLSGLRLEATLLFV